MNQSLAGEVSVLMKDKESTSRNEPHGWKLVQTALPKVLEYGINEGVLQAREQDMSTTNMQGITDVVLAAQGEVQTVKEQRNGDKVLIPTMQYREALQARRQEVVATAAIEALTKDSILHRRDVKALLKQKKMESREEKEKPREKTKEEQ
uniref:PHB domain-containing protein n=1 Tax=Steinernema glaseri TaxID=37863 RepID=A0A1I8ACT5_9BILA